MVEEFPRRVSRSDDLPRCSRDVVGNEEHRSRTAYCNHGRPDEHCVAETVSIQQELQKEWAYRADNILAGEDDAVCHCPVAVVVAFPKGQSGRTVDQSTAESGKNTLCKDDLPDMSAESSEHKADTAENHSTQGDGTSESGPLLTEEGKKNGHGQVDDSVRSCSDDTRGRLSALQESLASVIFLKNTIAHGKACRRRVGQSGARGLQGTKEGRQEGK